MALEQCFSFEHSLLEFNAAASAALENIPTGMTGVKCLGFASPLNGEAAYFNVTSRDTYYGSLRFYSNWTGNSGIISFREGTTDHIFISVDDDDINVYRGTTGSLLDQYTHGSSLINTTYWLKFYVYLDDTNGRVVVYLDDTSIIDFTGDTQSGGTGVIDNIGLGRGNGIFAVRYIDDVIITTADYPAAFAKVAGKAITANGYNNDFDLSDEEQSAYELVNDLDDDTFVYSNANGEVQGFEFADVSESINTVYGLKILCKARKQGAAAVSNIKLGVRSNGTNYYSGNLALATTYGYGKKYIWETDPGNGDIAWTENSLNNAQALIQAVT